MTEPKILEYVINDPIELNLSYMPFIENGGLFVPTQDSFSLGDAIVVDLKLPGKMENIRIEGNVSWITPRNALHHVISGIGIQFTGPNAPTIRNMLESMLDTKIEIGGYTYGMTGEVTGGKRSGN